MDEFTKVKDLNQGSKRVTVLAKVLNVGDLKGVDPQKISKVDSMQQIMESAVRYGKLTKIRSYWNIIS